MIKNYYSDALKIIRIEFLSKYIYVYFFIPLQVILESFNTLNLR